ncbi:MAG: DNA-3-methyladenine glycosylase [Candidatus Saccharibacteria bacterium]|nr:DNA-3-methyladenine glycosylase [Candidatus Saccharibacteria bacterium]
MDQSLDFLDGDVIIAAQRLLGCDLIRNIDGTTVRARIIETEAYDQSDVASHSYKGRTPRTDVMFGPAGHLYVYFTYGMHYCCNIVVGPENYGAAVLIRAVEPLDGVLLLEKRRRKSGIEVTNGPAKLCQALDIDKGLNGHNLRVKPLQLIVNKPVDRTSIIQTSRIGISRGKEAQWRFYIKDNPYVSKTAS